MIILDRYYIDRLYLSVLFGFGSLIFFVDAEKFWAIAFPDFLDPAVAFFCLFPPLTFSFPCFFS